MKQILCLFSPAFLWLCMACTQADIALPVTGGAPKEEGVPLSLRNLDLSVEVESRSIVTGGPGETDRNPNPLTAVGVCVTKQSSSGSVSVYADDNETQVFTYNTTASPPVWEPEEGANTLLLYSEKGTVYGYAPAEKSVSLSATLNVPLMSGVTVLDNQKFSFSDGDGTVNAATDVQWETDQEDYLYGTATEPVDRWHPEVSLLMNHALAKVSFRVLEAEGGTAFSDSQVKQVVLKSNGGFRKSTSAKLNLSAGDLSDTMTAVDQLTFVAEGNMRSIGSGESDAAQVAVQAFGLVIPVTEVAATLELTLNDGRVFTMKPSGSGEGPGTFTVDWKKGNNYIYNIRLSPQGIEIADIKVAGWGEGGSTDVPVE